MDTRIGTPYLADMVTAMLTDSWRGGLSEPITGCEVTDVLREFADRHPVQCAAFISEAISEASDEKLCAIAQEAADLNGITAAMAIRAYLRSCMEAQQAYLLSTERLAS
jgi:hypothetical protein